MLYQNFFKWMEEECVWNDNSIDSLKGFSKKLLAWNRDTFGNIFRMKKRLCLHLEGVQRAMDLKASIGLIMLEEKSGRNGLKSFYKKRCFGCTILESIGSNLVIKIPSSFILQQLFEEGRI